MRLIFLFLLSLLACSNDNAQSNQKSSSNQNSNFISYVAGAELPDKLSFCGESAPLDVPEIRERAEREFYLLLQQPGQLVLYIKRAGKYFPMYEKILKEKNVPEDLKYLSVAESALIMSRSAKDAVGLWQFMEGTAKKMGLRVDEYVDERRHPEKSTYAAIEYLKQGYQSTKSWTLAAAGYNMGHSGLASAIEFQETKKYYDLYLNEETSRYIFRILLIKAIMENPAKYGINLAKSDIYQPEKTKTIKVSSGIENLNNWARKYNATYKDVKLLNPWILKQSLNDAKGASYEILIPAN